MGLPCRTLRSLIEADRSRDITRTSVGLPTETGVGLTPGDGDAQAVSSLIKRIKSDPSAPGWKKKLVKHPFTLTGTPAHAAPEQFHSAPDDPYEPEDVYARRVKREPRVAQGSLSERPGMSPKEREQHAVGVSKTLSQAFPGRQIHTYRDKRGKIHVGTHPPPAGATRIAPASRTQAALSQTVS